MIATYISPIANIILWKLSKKNFGRFRRKILENFFGNLISQNFQAKTTQNGLLWQMAFHVSFHLVYRSYLLGAILA